MIQFPTCDMTGKLMFPTALVASGRRLRVLSGRHYKGRNEPDMELQVYRCAGCGQFHLGHSRKGRR